VNGRQLAGEAKRHLKYTTRAKRRLCKQQTVCSAAFLHANYRIISEARVFNKFDFCGFFVSIFSTARTLEVKYGSLISMDVARSESEWTTAQPSGRGRGLCTIGWSMGSGKSTDDILE